MNTIIPNTIEEKQSVSSPEKLLELMRQELISKGMAQDKVDPYILQNREKLGVGSDIVKIIEDGMPKEEIVEEKASVTPVQTEIHEDTGDQSNVESEMKKVREEISKEEENSKVELSSSEEEKTTVEQKNPVVQHSSGANIKVDGYSPSQEVAKNSDKLVAKGDVHQSQTWQAMLIERLEEIWGDIRGLFSAKQ